MKKMTKGRDHINSCNEDEEPFDGWSILSQCLWLKLIGCVLFVTSLRVVTCLFELFLVRFPCLCGLDIYTKCLLILIYFKFKFILHIICFM